MGPPLPAIPLWAARQGPAEVAWVARSATRMEQPRPSSSAPLPATRRWAAAPASATEARLTMRTSSAIPLPEKASPCTLSQCTFANNLAKVRLHGTANNISGAAPSRLGPGTYLAVLELLIYGQSGRSSAVASHRRRGHRYFTRCHHDDLRLAVLKQLGYRKRPPGPRPTLVPSTTGRA